MSNSPTPAPMVAFPDASDYLPLPSDPDSDRAWGRYEKARADAWEQRCRLAVEALQEVESEARAADENDRSADETHMIAIDALALIGELPPSPAAQE